MGIEHTSVIGHKVSYCFVLFFVLVFIIFINYLKLLYTKNIFSDNMYRDGMLKMTKFRNKILHDALVGEPFIIRIILF